MSNSILIVDDEKFLVWALKDNLADEGYEIDVATNGDEAMEHVRAHRPDLIFLDLLMPKRDGFYVLEEIKKDPKWRTIPVIVLTNLGGDLETARALALGADDYLVKSKCPIEEVIEKVKKYIGTTKTEKIIPATN
jgi:CheY-like chemotaxis protein